MSSLVKKIVIKLLRRPASRHISEFQLSESTAPSDPLKLFNDWFELAKSIDPEFANSVTLSTASAAGVPSNRIVLLKDYGPNGFVFYTNYGSRKAKELDNNPQASMVFWWKEVYRQIRIEGTTEKVSKAESANYFSSRPRGSKIGAWASRQSSTLADREELIHRVEEIEAQYPGENVPLPPFWGGYRLYPQVIEFWQGRDDRLHDRLRYRKELSQNSDKTLAGNWLRERLSP